MLKGFEVRNFKQFSSLVLDFSDVGDFTFSQDCLSKENKFIKTALVYGENGSGKSNLGLAIFDITQHLFNKGTVTDTYLFYQNADHTERPVEFKYTFCFDQKEVIYEYAKKDRVSLWMERLQIEGKEIFEWNHCIFTEGYYDRSTEYENFGDGSLMNDIGNRSIPEVASIIKQLTDFVSNMLWFRPAPQESNFWGLFSSTREIEELIIKENLVSEFQKFLNEHQVNEQLTVNKNPQGEVGLYFQHQQPLPFSVASSGTIALAVYFYSLHRIKEASFVFVDDFDAFYHFATAENLLKSFKKMDTQVVLTTHHTNLLSHHFVRPDACFVMKNGTLKSFKNLTQREIRKGNNLEKLYVSGEFND